MKKIFSLLWIFLLYWGAVYPKEDSEDISQMEISLSADCEPISTVANCVNVESGHFFQIDHDLTSNTISPISLTRYYDSHSRSESFFGSGFGCQFPLFISEIQSDDQHSYVMVSQRDGFLIPYRNDKHQNPFHLTRVFKIDPRLLEKGYTNTGGSHSNFMNWKALHEPACSPKGTSWTILLGDGTKHIYQLVAKLNKEDRLTMGFPTPTLYLLTEAIEPNGNKRKFEYQTVEGKPYLVKIQTLNRDESAILNELKMSYSVDRCEVKSSCGRYAFYSQKSHDCLFGQFDQVIKFKKKALKEVTSSQNGTLSYVTGSHQLSRVAKIEKPNGNFIEVKYDKDKKVESLYEPLGINAEKVCTYEFEYHKHLTKVWDALKQLTVYHFNPQHRLSRIDYLDQGGQPMRQEAFYWSTLNGQEGWLKAKAIHLKDALFLFQSYQYDEKGNIISEVTYGNLTGEKPQTFSLDQLQTVDYYKVNYRYSNDDFNLLIEKSTPDGLVISYDYLPGTNLRTKELVAYSGHIQERKFYSYDKNGQLKKVIEDDGSAQESTDLTEVTYRRIKTIEPIKDSHHASFGKPHIILESYLDPALGKVIRLKRTELSYDDKGYEVSQKVYDSKGLFCYETTKAYDSRGRIKKENNALGQVTRYAYDENNNKTKEELLGSGKKALYVYDAGNRLIRKEECHQHGEVFTTSYSYNSLNQLVAELDAYGQETTYTYDRLGRQIQCTKPAIQNANGQIEKPTLTKEYNALNQLISETNENGFTTRYTYNAYGKPIRIEYPDQGIEQFIYYPNGRLKQKWHADGSSLSYTYDPKGRVVKEALLTSEETALKEEEYGYKGALLTYKKDAMGLLTTYSYDGAGRKIEERIGNKKTAYVYDDLGRQIKIFKGLNTQEGQWEIYEYDALDRPLSKTLQDSQGQIYAKENYTYDIQGNLCSTSIWQSEDRVATYKSLYNSEGRPLWTEDSLGYKTLRKYNHHYTNSLGQQVITTTIEDALGRPTIEIEDVLHRLAKKEAYSDGKRVSSYSYTYDAVGNLTQQDVSVMQEGKLLRKYSILCSYNSRGDLISETEMPDGKTTHYAYDQRRRRIRKEKPDGNTLNYQYDASDRLMRMSSSDGSIDYSYTYDGHDNPIEIRDHVHQKTLKRFYDLHNRLIQEELTPSLVLNYHYDALDRLTKMTLPDGSFIRYIYDAFHLNKAQRYNDKKQLQYTYECQTYDLRGNLLKGESSAGSNEYEYDLMARAIAIKAPQWESYLEKIDPVGNVLSQFQKTPNGQWQETFGYDRFNHLSKEQSIEANDYLYDSLGNCLKKNQSSLKVNSLNQLTKDASCQYRYDANGNLIYQTNPPIFYTYDALNRLICIEKEGKQTHLTYDAFGRCMQIKDGETIKRLIYFREKEIGSFVKGKLQELKVINPTSKSEAVFAIECNGQTFFPIQDFRYNICALHRSDGTLAQWHHYSAFGQKELHGDQSIDCPWLFANRREVEGILLFAHRFYSPQLMRWLTTDPLRFKSGINLYTYNCNNPFSYTDPDGRCPIVLALPILNIGFGAVGITISATTINTLLVSTGVALVGWSAYQLDKHMDYGYLHKQNEPRFNGKDLGDPTQCPEEGFEWKGRGKVGSSQGSWHNKDTNESLHPDFNHAPPVKPHWDYESPDHPKGVRLYQDGTWEPK